MMCPLCDRFRVHLRVMRNLARSERLQDVVLDDTITLPMDAKERIKNRLLTPL